VLSQKGPAGGHDWRIKRHKNPKSFSENFDCSVHTLFKFTYLFLLERQMSAFSNKTEADIVNHFLRGVAVPASGDLYLALFTVDPGESGFNNEATYLGYERQLISFTEINGDGDTTNAEAILFPANLGDSQTITASAVYDSADTQAGIQVIHGGLIAPKTLNLNDLLAFGVGGLVLNIN
jgi:hypothetical protein